METCIEWYRDRVDISKIFFDSLINKVTDYRNQVIDLMYKNNQLVNLMLIILWTGPSIQFDSYKNITKHKVIDRKAFDIKYKEFNILYEDKYSEDICNSPTFKDRMRAGLIQQKAKVSSDSLSRIGEGLLDESMYYDNDYYSEYDSENGDEFDEFIDNESF